MDEVMLQHIIVIHLHIDDTIYYFESVNNIWHLVDFFLNIKHRSAPLFIPHIDDES